MEIGNWIGNEQLGNWVGSDGTVKLNRKKMEPENLIVSGFTSLVGNEGTRKFVENEGAVGKWSTGNERTLKNGDCFISVSLVQISTLDQITGH